MVFDMLLKIAEFFSNKGVYLFTAAVLWVSIFMISILGSDRNTNSFGYIVFVVALCTVISLLWPLSVAVKLIVYIYVTICNIDKINKKYKDLKNKLCGITDC